MGRKCFGTGSVRPGRRAPRCGWSCSSNICSSKCLLGKHMTVNHVAARPSGFDSRPLIQRSKKSFVRKHAKNGKLDIGSRPNFLYRPRLRPEVVRGRRAGMSRALCIGGYRPSLKPDRAETTDRHPSGPAGSCASLQGEDGGALNRCPRG